MATPIIISTVSAHPDSMLVILLARRGDELVMAVGGSRWRPGAQRLSAAMFDVEALRTFTAIAAPTGAEDERLGWLERRLEGRQGFASATESAT